MNGPYKATLTVLTTLTLMATSPRAIACGDDSELLKPWTGSYGGVPRWDLVRPAEFPDAFDKAIKQASAQIDAIASNPQEATFENTLVAMERAGESLNRLAAIFSVHTPNLNVGSMPEIENQ